MKHKLLYGLGSILAVLIFLIYEGYSYSCSSRSKVNEIWKQTVREDCAFRLHEIGTVIRYALTATPSSDIVVVTENDTAHIKKDGTKFCTAAEKELWTDQYYLALRNPIKLENLENLFRQKLQENGLAYQTAVLRCDEKTKESTLYGVKDGKALNDYISTEKVDYSDLFSLEGYVKGNWIEACVWGTGYYVVLFIGVLVVLLFIIKRCFFLFSASSGLADTKLPDAEGLVAVKPEKAETQVVASEKMDFTIVCDPKRHLLFYAGRAIYLPPKLFALFYALSQGEGYFQSYSYLFEVLKQGNEEIDKGIIDQLIFRLRKELEKNIPIVNLEVVRAKGCRLKARTGMELRIDALSE